MATGARQRTKSAYIFGAICPQEGKAAGLVLPFCNTDMMNLHLAEISLHVALGAPLNNVHLSRHEMFFSMKLPEANESQECSSENSLTLL